MASIRTLIVDDEPLARKGIRAQLKREIDIEVVGECANGLEAVAAIQLARPDLVFLDIQMPELDGCAVVEAIGVSDMPCFIFVTAYDRYALRAFEVHAVDYLLKPLEPERFREALDRARSRLQGRTDGQLNQSVTALIKELRSTRNHLERLAVKSAGRIFFLNVGDVTWIQAADNYVNVHVGASSQMLRETMSNLEARLDPARFLRVHRSAIVNIEKIKELQPLFHGDYEIILKDGTRISSGRGYRDGIQRLLKNSLVTR